MVEMEGADVPVVAAQDTGSAGLRDELQPCPSPPVDDTLLPASVSPWVAQTRVANLGRSPATTRTLVRVADGNSGLVGCSGEAVGSA